MHTCLQTLNRLAKVICDNHFQLDAHRSLETFRIAYNMGTPRLKSELTFGTCSSML